MFLLDSCICINLMRGVLPRTLQLMQESSPKLFGIPFIVEAELLTGAEKSSNPAQTRLKVERFLAPFQRVEFDSSCAHAYAQLRADLERRGCKIGPNDLVIASCAVAHGATLISGNIREFSCVKGLRLENWEELEL